MSNDAAGTSELRQREATILVTDVVGYSRLMGVDSQGTLAELDAVTDIVRAHVESRGGYIANIAGDAAVAIFDTDVGAVYASCAVQDDLAVRASQRPDDRRMRLRLGVTRGVVFERPDGGVFGDAVNIAARLQALAPAGGIAVSSAIRAASEASVSRRFIDQGEFKVKNIDCPVHVFLLEVDTATNSVSLLQDDERPVVLGNIPARRGQLFGRSAELRDIAEELEKSRLVTLLGMGGLGKTTLSIEVAHQTSYKYPDGVWFADLGSVSEGSAVAASLSGLFGVSQQGGKSLEASLIESLRGRRMLLILDNCEHVTESASTLADLILSECPRTSILATSREVLSVAGEQIYQIAPLDVSGDATAAVDLFRRRATAVSPTFNTDDAEEEIRSICQQLDGIPLAIELAAARTKSLMPAQIRERLDQRFRLLTGGSRAKGRERHQTLFNAVQWSYDLLSESEKALLDRASVFAGGFTLEAAERVCSGDPIDPFDVADLLDSLTSKSLLLTSSKCSGMRYRMLETIRAFGTERLQARDESHAIQRAHAELYAAQSCENFETWRSPSEREAYVWLDLEINNLRNAFFWAKQNDEVDIAARIAASVGDIGRFRLIEEVAGWAEEIVDQARDVAHPRLVILLTWSASTAWAFSRFDDARRFGEEAISLLDDDRFIPFVWAYGDLAFVALYAGDVDKALALLKTGATHPADARDRFIMAFHLYFMAVTGRAGEALEMSEEVVSAVDSAGVPMAMAIAHGARGAALEAVDPEQASREYETGIELAAGSGARFMESLLAPRLVALRSRTSDPLTALAGFERFLQSMEKSTDIATFSTWQASLVMLFAKTRQYHAAATLHGTLDDLVDQSGTAPEHAEAVREIRDVLGLSAFSEATRTGAAMSLREATEYAIAQVQLGLKTLANTAAS